MTSRSQAKPAVLPDVDPPDASPTPATAVAGAHTAEVRRMRETVERHFKAHRALGALLRRLVDPKGETRHVEVQPRLPVASLAQHPRRIPRAEVDPWWPTEPPRPARPLEANVGHELLTLADHISEAVGVSVMGLRGRTSTTSSGSLQASRRRRKTSSRSF
jgi:hypothetical protein